MKRFDTFGEYMFDLLFAPLKRGKRTANQLFIFFKVVGRVFDGMKKDAFRVRDEANVATASPVMLPVHGQDRDMPRLEGEDMVVLLVVDRSYVGIGTVLCMALGGPIICAFLVGPAAQLFFPVSEKICVCVLNQFAGVNSRS